MTLDLDKFGLRRFMEQLVAAGECIVHSDPIELVDVAAILDGNEKAVWFRAAGPERAELVGNVMGSRRRIAMAFDVESPDLPAVLRERMQGAIPPIEISSERAPVQQIVLTGDDADLCALPVSLQHGRDGAPYISASIDFVRDSQTGGINIGCRRMMLRGTRSAGVDLNAPSDLRAIYQRSCAAGHKLEVAYVVGSHPIDFLTATASARPMDELHLMGALRNAPVPVVRCKTIDVMVPADAEFVLEGYLDEKGLTEPEGPYGEFLGYYGSVKRNPVFHLTAITRRNTALFQTVTIGGRSLGRTDTAQLVAAKTEASIWMALGSAVREPVAVCCTASCGGMFNVRVSLRQRYPGEARNAIAAVFASTADVKNVFVVDDDIDVFDDGQIDWALATRFQADKDFVAGSNFRAVPIDPSLDGKRSGSKGGFDCTKPLNATRLFEYAIPLPPVMPPRIHQSVSAALAAGPATFLELMSAAGTRDGREVLRELELLSDRGQLIRGENGHYLLNSKTV
jgi:UbiD family decarboxylase